MTYIVSGVALNSTHSLTCHRTKDEFKRQNEQEKWCHVAKA